MSSKKEFNEGDKVFAKVKGYPAWPAKITKRKGNKYDVFFYGTNETGTVKAQDIQLCLDAKDRLKKPINKKFYKQALKEVREELENDGIIIDNDDDKINDSTNKRKRESSISDTEKEKIESKPKKAKKEAKKTTKATNKITKITDNEVDLISADFLNQIVDFANIVQNRRDHYIKKQLKHNDKKNCLVPIKMPTGEFLFVKYQPKNAKNEFEQAINDSKTAKTVLELLEKLQECLIKADDAKELINFEFTLEENEIKNRLLSKIKNRKNEISEFLKMESELSSIDSKIRSALELKKADCEKALDNLKTLEKMQVNGLMLKKNVQIVETIKMLKKYVGNPDEWEMDEDEKKEFEDKAEEIRKLADSLYETFSKLLGCKNTKKFWDFYENSVEIFKENCKNFEDIDIISLCAEPDSWEAFFDLRLDEIDLDIENVKNSEKPKRESKYLAVTDENKGEKTRESISPENTIENVDNSEEKEKKDNKEKLEKNFEAEKNDDNSLNSDCNIEEKDTSLEIIENLDKALAEISKDSLNNDEPTEIVKDLTKINEDMLIDDNKDDIAMQVDENVNIESIGKEKTDLPKEKNDFEREIVLENNGTDQSNVAIN